MIAGELTLGQFIRFNSVPGLLLVLPLRMIGMWMGQYQRAMASGERIFEVLDIERDIIEPPTPGRCRTARARPDREA